MTGLIVSLIVAYFTFLLVMIFVVKVGPWLLLAGIAALLAAGCYAFVTAALAGEVPWSLVGLMAAFAAVGITPMLCFMAYNRFLARRKQRGTGK